MEIRNQPLIKVQCYVSKIFVEVAKVVGRFRKMAKSDY